MMLVFVTELRGLIVTELKQLCLCSLPCVRWLIKSFSLDSFSTVDNYPPISETPSQPHLELFGGILLHLHLLHLLRSTGRSQICSPTDVVNRVVSRRLSAVPQNLVSRSVSSGQTSFLWSSKSGVGLEHVLRRLVVISPRTGCCVCLVDPLYVRLQTTTMSCGSPYLRIVWPIQRSFESVAYI